jgi:hypothetical protein
LRKEKKKKETIYIASIGDDGRCRLEIMGREYKEE